MFKRVIVFSGSVLVVGLLFASAQSQEESARSDVPIGSRTQRAREVIKSDEKKNALEILEVKFDPIHQGKNVVRVKVKNVSRQARVFLIHIQTQSPKYLGRYTGFGRPFFDHLEDEQTKWTRFEFTIPGPITDATWIRLRFDSPPSVDNYDNKKWFKELKYTGRELERRNWEIDQEKPATKAQQRAVKASLRQIQEHMENKEYEGAWVLFTEDYRDSRSLAEDLKKPLDDGMFEKLGFFDVKVQSILQHVGCLRLNARNDNDVWAMDFMEENGQWKINVLRWSGSRLAWKEWLLPKMQKRSTPHFDVHYVEGSTAEREIDQIVKRREKGFREICSFLGKPSDVRICLVFFENAEVKHAKTGHQGAGWAVGRTIVEVYNQKQRLDPYHETVHILTPPYGKPPALFNEGIAVYMAERLGAHALALHGPGPALIYARARELKDKGEWIPLQELLTYTEIGPGWSRPPIAYPEAASFVKFLIDEYGREKFLEAFKTLKNSRDEAVHRKNVTALEQIYDKPLDDLRKQWEKALSTAGNTPDSSASLPEEGSRNDSPDDRAMARGKVQAEIPENLRISDYFYFCGSEAAERNSRRIIFIARSPSVIVATRFARLDLPASIESQALLFAGRLRGRLALPGPLGGCPTTVSSSLYFSRRRFNSALSSLTTPAY